LLFLFFLFTLIAYGYTHGSTPMGSKTCCWFESSVVLQVVTSQAWHLTVLFRGGISKASSRIWSTDPSVSPLQINLSFFTVDLSLLQSWQRCISKFCWTPFLSFPLL